MPDLDNKGNTRLPDEARERLWRIFSERVDRLKGWIELDAPGAILCTEVGMVFRRACALYPEYMGQEIASWVRNWEMAGAGICPECGGFHRVFSTCDACMDKAVGEILEEEEAAAKGDCDA